MQLTRYVLIAAAALGAAAVSYGPLAAQGLEGRWSLVEQRYGEGGHDFAHRDGELTVSLRFDAGRPVGEVAWERGRAPWPAYPTPDGPAPVEVSSRSAAPDLSWVEARYAVPAAAADGTRLVIHERWELTEPDRAECSVEIAFERDGERRGSFVWHRVFVREGTR